MEEIGHSSEHDSGARDYSAELLGAILGALPAWIDATIRRRTDPGSDHLASVLNGEIQRCTREMVEKIDTALTSLFALDVEHQRMNPLQVLRDAASIVGDCLSRLGAQPAVRDEFERASLPTDVYGVGPLTWRDLGEQVHEAGIAWGAWKAATVISRHRAKELRQ